MKVNLAFFFSHSRKWMALLGVLFTLGFVFFLWPENSFEPVFLQAEKKDFPVFVVAKGHLEAQNSITITCPLNSAKIKSLVTEGVIVKKGEVLIQFDDEDLAHEVFKLELELVSKEKEKNKAVAELEADRAEALLKIEKLKIDALIADLQLKDLQSLPRENDLRIARMEFEQAKLVQKTAQEEYQRIKSNIEKDLVKEVELGKLEMELEKAKSKYRESDLNLKLVFSGASYYQMEQERLKREKLNLQYQELEASLPDKMKEKQNQIEEAQTNFESTQNRLKKAREKLKEATIISPQAGLVIYRKVWGQKIAAGKSFWKGVALLDIPNLELMQLNGKVLENEISQIEIGQKASIVVDGIPDREFLGEVRKIGKVAVDTSERDIVGWLDRNKKSATGIKVFEVSLEIKEKTPLLLPQMTAKGKISIQKIAQVITLPQVAIEKKQGKAYIYIYENQQKKKREVTLGVSSGYEVVITKGLKEGEKVIIAANRGGEK